MQNLESVKDAKDSCNSCFRKWGALLACKKLALRPRKIRGLNCNTCASVAVNITCWDLRSVHPKLHPVAFGDCPPGLPLPFARVGQVGPRCGDREGSGEGSLMQGAVARREGAGGVLSESGWLAACLACWLAGWLAGLLACWLAGLLVGWFTGWLAGWFAGWLACLLVGWLLI